MKKYISILIVVALIVIALIVTIVVRNNYIKIVKSDRDRLSQNQYILQSDIKRYRTSDSLSAVSLQELSFTLNEYKKFRSEDLQTIKTLKNDISRLQGVNTTQLQTIYYLQNIGIRDSIDPEQLIPVVVSRWAHLCEGLFFTKLNA